MDNVKINIEKLIRFALANNMIKKWDIQFVRNNLMDILKIDEPYEKELEEYEIDKTPVDILNELLQYAINKGIIEDNITNRDMLDSRIMNAVMPRPSEVVSKFYEIVNNEGIEKATDYYYKLSRDSNYIRMDRINKNKYWLADTEVGKLEITINLSKPEKDPEEIEKAKNMPDTKYPKCFLCIDNVGYPGRLNHPARNNHRVIEVNINNENWYLQYSPYVYYNEHCIVFNEKHTPMKISKHTFIKLISFVEKFPHYFVGSNADLPIVGGSILSHDHFQGGHHVFPMENAPIIKKIENKNYRDVDIAVVKWPLSVIRLSSKNKEQLIELADELLIKWRNYSDETYNILAYTDDKGKKIPHNTITPIARINQDGNYELDLVLRNNRRSKEYPEGIFHPHAHLHHIKKENIGLIEVMGLAVLPARLEKELLLIQDILTGKLEDAGLYNELDKHSEWINKMIRKYGTNLNVNDAWKYIKLEVGNIFLEVLECAGVYKMDERGLEGIIKFIKS